MAKSVLGIDLKMKSLFFDRDAVIDQTNRLERKALSKIGAFVRRRARSLIRRKKRRKSKRGKQPQRSKPGNPPVAWESPGIKDILFHFDAREKSVVIGPLMFNGTPDVPGTLELGGTAEIWESRSREGELWFPGRWRQGDPETRRRKVQIQPRPFMGPALAAEKQTIEEAFDY